MKIALAGLGRTGTVVEALAMKRGHTIVERFDEHRPVDTSASESWSDVDVVIDFTSPTVILDHIKIYCTNKVHAVIGTTGWYDALPEVRKIVSESGSGLLYAQNFSLGVALMIRCLEHLSPLVNALEDVDVFVHEIHHRHKRDSPSGTALRLGETLLQGLDRKAYLAMETQHDTIDPTALHVTSTRAGEVFGTHTVVFDGAADQLRITHEAKNRTGFALGAVQAAEWLHGKKGLFTLDDLLNAWLTP